MKAFVYAVVIALLVNNAVEASRGLNQVVATATAVSNGGGNAYASSNASGHRPTSATAVSVANGCGANAKTKATAKDGADVKGTTVADSKNCADVNAVTDVEGNGENADIDQTTIVKSDKDIDVVQYVKRYDNGHDVYTIAGVIIKDFDGYTYERQYTALTYFASQEKYYPLFEACVGTLYKERGCDTLKLIIKGHETDFIVYKVPDDIYGCLYYKCSGYESARNCCGKAQLSSDYCSCSYGKCLWSNPHKKSYYPYWSCSDCGEEISFCVC